MTRTRYWRKKCPSSRTTVRLDLTCPIIAGRHEKRPRTHRTQQSQPIVPNYLPSGRTQKRSLTRSREKFECRSWTRYRKPVAMANYRTKPCTDIQPIRLRPVDLSRAEKRNVINGHRGNQNHLFRKTLTLMQKTAEEAFLDAFFSRFEERLPDLKTHRITWLKTNFRKWHLSGSLDGMFERNF